MGTTIAAITGDIRTRIIKDPDLILSDRDVMRALVGTTDAANGENVVDMRGLAMDRLEARLDRLEETHRSVIAAAYENLAGTNQIHRAVLRMLDPVRFEAFLHDLSGPVADILRVDSVKLVLETASEGAPRPSGLEDVLVVAGPGFVSDYVTRGRGAPPRQVTLRQMRPGDQGIHGEAGDWIASEACIALDLGEGRLPGMLVMGCEDPHQFKPGQGTELLAFFGGVFERSMRRWLD